MNRTDRLYALVEELRAVAPRPRSARWLAGRFEVSARTVERDISALQQSGVPIWAEPGRTGGYCLDKARTLPPVNLTPGEAVALAVALRQLDGTPFLADAGTALRKLVRRCRPGTRPPPGPGRAHPPARPARRRAAAAPMPRLVADALQPRRVLRIGYADRAGAVTEREIEPLGYVGSPAAHWYLMAWCRLRDGLRAFRTDRITAVDGHRRESAPPRPAAPPARTSTSRRRQLVVGQAPTADPLDGRSQVRDPAVRMRG